MKQKDNAIYFFFHFKNNNDQIMRIIYKCKIKQKNINYF